MARVVSSPFKEWLSFINTELATIAAQIFCCTEIFQKLTAAFLDNTLIAMTMAGYINSHDHGRVGFYPDRSYTTRNTPQSPYIRKFRKTDIIY